jgi:hypothetical protein
MKQFMSTSILCFALSICFGQPEEPELERCLRAWKSRQQQIVAVYCETEAQSVIFRGRFDRLLEGKNPVPDTDIRFSKQTTWEIDFGSGLVRRESTDLRFFPDLKKFVPTYRVDLFDGDQCYGYSPRERNSSESYKPSELQPDLWFKGKLGSDAFFGFRDFPVFFACGGVPFRFNAPLPNTLVRCPDATQIRSFGSVMTGGRRCVVLRTIPERDRFDEYWVDMEKGPAIIRWTNLSVPDRVHDRLEMDYRKTDDGWLLKKWTTTAFDPKTQNSLWVDEVEVKKLVFNRRSPRAQFSISPTPGMTVGKVGKRNLTFFRVAATGELEELSPDGRSGGRGTSFFWFVAGGSFFLGFLLLWRYSRRRRAWCLIGILAVSHGSNLRAGDDLPPIDTIFQTWARHSAMIHYARFKWSKKQEIPRRALVNPFQATKAAAINPNEIHVSHTTCTLVLDQEKMRFEMEGNLPLGGRHPCERSPGRHGKQAAMPAGRHGCDRGRPQGTARRPGWLSREHAELDRAAGGFEASWLDLGSQAGDG